MASVGETSSPGTEEGEPWRRFSTSITLQYHDLTFENELGRGGFGVVSKGRLQGEPVAIKTLYSSVSNWDDVAREINIMHGLSHPNVVRLIGCTTPPDPVCIVTELMENGALATLLHEKKDAIPTTTRVQFALDIARGMEYLHSRSVVHSDLNLKNVLVSSSGVCKVSDFGLSLLCAGMSKSITNAGKGTLMYTAPEVFRMERVSTKADVYAFGICLWELWYPGKKAFGQMHYHAICFNVVTYNLRPAIDENNKPVFQKLMQACWDADSLRRPRFSAVAHSLSRVLDRMKERKSLVAQRSSRSLSRVLNFETSEEYWSDSIAEEASPFVADEFEPPAMNGDWQIGPAYDVAQWSEADCCAWAAQHNMLWAVDVLKQNDISGRVLLTLTPEDVRMLFSDLSFGRRRLFQVELQHLLEKVEQDRAQRTDARFDRPVRNQGKPLPHGESPSITSLQGAQSLGGGRSVAECEEDMESLATTNQLMGTTESVSEFPAVIGGTSMAESPGTQRRQENTSVPGSPLFASDDSLISMASISVPDLIRNRIRESSPKRTPSAAFAFDSKRRSRSREMIRGFSLPSFTSIISRFSHSHRKRMKETAEEGDNILGQALLAHAYAGKLWDECRFEECYRHLLSEALEITAACEVILRNTPGPAHTIMEKHTDAELDRNVESPMDFPYVYGPEFTWKDHLIVFATVIRAKMRSAIENAKQPGNAMEERATIMMAVFKFAQNAEPVTVTGADTSHSHSTHSLHSSHSHPPPHTQSPQRIPAKVAAAQGVLV